MIYSLYTLVDITATGQYRSRNDLERLQQQNFDTVIQTIGLSGNVYYEKPPQIIPADIFGAGDQKCWHFEWHMEIEELFEKNGDQLYRLKDSFELFFEYFYHEYLNEYEVIFFEKIYITAYIHQVVTCHKHQLCPITQSLQRQDLGHIC